MKTVPLRYLAEINPPTPAFDVAADNEEIGFLPLEAVWSDTRADHARRVPKRDVATGYTRYQTGDVVCPKVTPTFQAGRSMIASTLGAGTTELHILRPRNGVDARWVAYALRSKDFLDEGVAAFQGVAGLQRVPPEYVASFRVVDHPRDEQRRIADFLDDRVARIDQIVAARQEQQSLVRAVAANTLQGEFDSLVERFGEVRLGFVLIGMEQGWSPQAEAVPAGPDEWGVMRAGCVNGGLFRPEDNKRLPDGLNPVREYEIRGGDLLMSRASGSLDLIGSVAVVPKGIRAGLLLCDKICRLTPARGWLPGFLALMLRARRNRELIRLGTSGAEGMANNLPSSAVRELLVPLAPIDGQQLTCAKYDAESAKAEQVIGSIDMSVALLQEFKQSLITAAVTGELDVTTASRGIPG